MVGLAIIGQKELHCGTLLYVAPVFLGLASIGVSGKNIAASLGVSDASVSKWRNGRTAFPDETKVFLSLMLGEKIIEAGEDGDSAFCLIRNRCHIEIAKDKLAEQELLNQGMPCMAVWKGVRKYRVWWNAIKNIARLNSNNISSTIG